MTDRITSALEQAVEGLLYRSESDEPFEVLSWSGDGRPIDAGKLLHLASKPSGTQLEEISLDDFFQELTKKEVWYEDEEKADVQRYSKLESSLHRLLSDIKVFRVGEVEIDIYIIGLAPDGDWAGIKTASVET